VGGISSHLSLHHLDGLPTLPLVFSLADAGNHAQTPMEGGEREKGRREKESRHGSRTREK